ncbi:MAG: ribonuclease [Betaproteobacteria bacterium HGW-Betaproteobacteria-7]|jgi:ribonuclease T1|nr:MAG: ribonuclease [Betaproteobacteria bacterium HGW-Betaproteobacteria-7]
MSNWQRFLIVLLLAIGSAFAFWNGNTDRQTIDVGRLPPEARETLALIKQGGPFPYQRDGIVFNNFEKLLPLHPRGYYREYTVKTPSRKDRGPRRIVAGKAAEYYYTDDHYKSFRRIRE